MLRNTSGPLVPGHAARGGHGSATPFSAPGGEPLRWLSNGGCGYRRSRTPCLLGLPAVALHLPINSMVFLLFELGWAGDGDLQGLAGLVPVF
eukprot:15846214-Heterocapsa_arctica.AAC.1